MHLGTRALGLAGVILAVVAVNVVERGVAAVHFSRLLGAGRRDIVLLRDIGKLGLASMIAGTVCSILRSSLGAAGPLVVLAAFAVVYLFAIYFLRVLSAEERGPAREFAARRLPVPWRYRLD